MHLEIILQNITNTIVLGAIRVISAVVVWIIGGWIIKAVVSTVVVKGMRFRHLEETIIGYVSNTVTVVLKITLAIAILSMIGIETTSFAALIAAAGLAIGAAWSGLLANFAAGAFLVILRPFKAGDFIEAGGVMGTVEEVGLFVTTINTLDNVRTIVGNNKVFSDNIKNFSTNPYRRVDLVAQIDHGVNAKKACDLLAAAIKNIPNVVAEPSPSIEILELNEGGPILAVRPYCNNKNYWQVYFDTNRVIKETFTEAKFHPPQHHLVISNNGLTSEGKSHESVARVG